MAILSPGTRKALAILLAVLATGTAAGQPLVTSEDEVKAAFLYNFAKFVEWPEAAFRGPREPLTLCVLGSDAFGRELEAAIDGKTVQGRQVVIRRTLQILGLEACRILFVSSSERPRFEQILASVGRRPVLTVGEDVTFARTGGIINFVVESKRIRFQINQGAAERAGLKISSRLLELGEVVGGGEDGKS
jgi:YfiR/HmsC-like